MSEATDLNAMLNNPEVQPPATTEAAPLATPAAAAPAPAAAPATENVSVVTAEAPAATAEATVQMDTSSWVDLNAYLTTHKDKITNAGMVSLAGFQRIPEGKYLLFITNEQPSDPANQASADASMILFDEPKTLRIPSIVPESITVKNSGIIIRAAGKRIYAGKNNVTMVEVDSTGKISSMYNLGRGKDNGSIKITQEAVQATDTTVDETLLYLKKVSPRLYGKAKECKTKPEIKGVVENYMVSIQDINHLVKIEKDLLHACKM